MDHDDKENWRPANDVRYSGGDKVTKHRIIPACAGPTVRRSRIGAGIPGWTR